ncbi:MAG: 5-(carboxyamino)imidazole ribonucleotide synthase [Micropepsaceae bacterium]
MNEPKPLSSPVEVGETVGILGGGQLGRMLAQAAKRLDLKTHIYSDERDAPAFQVADASTYGRYDDEKALDAFARDCALVTFEFENVPTATARHLSRQVPVAPSPHALEIAQDRLLEKTFVESLGIPTAAFREVRDESTAREAFRALGAPAILKTARLGYDGKGQAMIRSEDEIIRAFLDFGAVPAILEDFVDFSYEVSVVAARGRDGAFAAFDPPKNEHENHILRRSTVPSPLSDDSAVDAIRIAQRIADALDYVGVLGVELFVGRDEKLAVNEIAPRVHNSGHWTIEACATSQFEQHLRAVAGWPLGDPTRHCDAVMENIIGVEVEAWSKMEEKVEGLHLYGKGEPRDGRKMGHITRTMPPA